MGTLAVKPDRLTKYKGLGEDKPRESGGIPLAGDNYLYLFVRPDTGRSPSGEDSVYLI